MRHLVLKDLHASHQGIIKTVERAKTALYWPGMQTQITDLIEACSICQENRSANQKEPLVQQEVPAFPHQKVGSDLFSVGGKDYLIAVDYYSKWFNIYELRVTKSSGVIEALQQQFANFGTPEELI